ncbi:MAG: DUF6370 family protein [Gemmataceae bacterium]
MRLVALIVVAGLLPALASHAQDKEVVLAGNITCARCELKKEARCMTVLVVKEGDKERIYYFDPKAHKDIHREVCKAGRKGKVTGQVVEKDGTFNIIVRKIDFE